jgi:hypothetical protein
MPEKYLMPDMNEMLTEQDKQLLKNILLIFIAMVSMQGILLLVAIVFAQSEGPLMPGINAYYDSLLIGTVALSFICTVLAKRHIMKFTRAAKNSSNPLSEILIKYRTALIVYMAISELPVLVCIVLSVLTGNFVFQVFAAVLLGYLLAEMPRKDKVLSQLR